MQSGGVKQLGGETNYFPGLCVDISKTVRHTTKVTTGGRSKKRDCGTAWPSDTRVVTIAGLMCAGLRYTTTILMR